MTKGRGARLGRLSGVLAAGAAAAVALPAGVSLAAVQPPTNVYVRTDLVSDNPRLTPTVDPNTVNPWGVSEFPKGPLWVSNEGRGNTTLYGGADGSSATLNRVPLVVSIPGGRPTGQAFNTFTKGFTITDGKTKAPAVFLFATLNGTIAGWAPTVGNGTAAQVGTTVPGAVFTGLAQLGSFLYAADPAHDKVDVFGPDFKQVSNPNAFQDDQIPAGFTPFNVTATSSVLVVTYSSARAGVGQGFVDVYSPGGALLQRLVRGGLLDQPWGVALAPGGNQFGPFSGALLVGNHGNGRINAYNPATGRFLGTILQTNGRAFTAPNLWGLIFGDGPTPAGTNPPSAGRAGTLFFTEGAIAPGRDGEVGDISFLGSL